MRIDDANRLPQTQAPSSSQQTAKDVRTRTTDAGADRAELSTLARSLEGPDDKRLEALRVEVESGKYKVSASALAGSIIDSHLKS